MNEASTSNTPSVTVEPNNGVPSDGIPNVSLTTTDDDMPTMDSDALKVSHFALSFHFGICYY